MVPKERNPLSPADSASHTQTPRFGPHRSPAPLTELLTLRVAIRSQARQVGVLGGGAGAEANPVLVADGQKPSVSGSIYADCLVRLDPIRQTEIITCRITVDLRWRVSMEEAG